MPDLLGYRAKMGQLVPSTNTVMEPETHAMAPPGVTFHTARIFLAQPSIRSADEARRAADAFREALQIAVRDVLTAQPDHLLIGVSALSFMGGIAGHRRFTDEIATAANIPVTTAAGALTAALPLFGVNRIGVLSPHPPMFDEHYLRFFGETG